MIDIESIYLDNAATTKPHPEVIQTVIDLLQGGYWYNSHSAYEKALECRRIIENVKQVIADKINCKPTEIVFTQSASCSNALAINGFMNKNDCCNFVCSDLEHPSILDIELYNPHKFKNIIKCNNASGVFKPEQFEPYRNCLVSVCAASPVIGTIQPIKEIVKVVHENNKRINCRNVIHSDLTAYWPYFNVDVKELNLDMATLSSHKIHGLKNCSVLYIKEGIELATIIAGHDLWNGTLDIYNVAAFGKAVEMLSYDHVDEVKQKRDYLLDRLLDIKGVYLNGDRKNRLPNNINIRIEGLCVDNQQLVALCDLMGYMISAGTSCMSGNKEPSPSLLTLGLSEEQANSSIRITIGDHNTYEELDKFYNDFKNIVEQYRN